MPATPSATRRRPGESSPGPARCRRCPNARRKPVGYLTRKTPPAHWDAAIGAAVVSGGRRRQPLKASLGGIGRDDTVHRHSGIVVHPDHILAPGIVAGLCRKAARRCRPFVGPDQGNGPLADSGHRLVAQGSAWRPCASAPQLRSVRLNEKEQAAGVGQLVGALGRLRGFDLQRGQYQQHGPFVPPKHTLRGARLIGSLRDAARHRIRRGHGFHPVSGWRAGLNISVNGYADRQLDGCRAPA